MIRRPPRSTLFPYRRSSDLRASRPAVRPLRRAGSSPALGFPASLAMAPLSFCAPATTAYVRRPSLTSRSEEHTYELQSLAYLVCRLLLEKKKKQSDSPTRLM